MSSRRLFVTESLGIEPTSRPPGTNELVSDTNPTAPAWALDYRKEVIK